jgi:epoxyqueuosine reductase QueG
MVWEQYIKDNGTDFVYFINTSTLQMDAVDEYSCVILFGKILSKEYINTIIIGQKPKRHEFNITERKMDALAVKLADRLQIDGYKSIAKLKSGQLPHKTVALRAGLGFIGKNNLLVNDQYGSAIVLGKTLTTAPFKTIKSVSPKKPECGNCMICADKCETKALQGKTWDITITRKEMLVIKLCNCCLNCMVYCPYTVKYAKS